MADDPLRGFLGRWSRLKREAVAAEAVPPSPPAALPPLPADEPAAAPVPDEAPPPLESLDFESDYRAFLGQKVDEGLKRAALKKLFNTPHFNTMDGLDVYTEDFNVFEPMPASMVAELMHSKETLWPTLPADWLKPAATADAAVPEVAAAVATDAAADAATELTGPGVAAPGPVEPDPPRGEPAAPSPVDEVAESRSRSE